MQLGYNNIEAMPLTSTKLNFYLAQCNRSKSKNEKQQYANHSNRDHYSAQKNIISPHINSFDLQLKDHQNLMNHSQPKANNKQNWSPIKQQKLTNQSGVSINVRENCNSFTSPLPLCHNDSLDNLLTIDYNNSQLNNRANQRFTERNHYHCQNSYKDIELLKANPNYPDNAAFSNQPAGDESYCFPHDSRVIRNRSLSPYEEESFARYSPRSIIKNRESIACRRQSKIGYKRVNWRTQSKKLSKKNSYNLKLDEGFREISNQLSAITYELNSNSKKLQQLNRVYGIKKKAHLNPQQTLERANKKYSCAKRLSKDLKCGFRTRPEVQYDGHLFNDPKYLIWQPNRQGNKIYRPS